MEPAEVTLQPLFRGDPRTIVFNVTDLAGDPVNLSASSWSSTVREFTTASFGQALEVDWTQSAEGVIRVDISGDQSRLFGRRIVADLQGSIFGTLARVRAVVLPDVTRGDEEPIGALTDIVNLTIGSDAEISSTIRAVILTNIDEHLADPTPHPAYDDIPSLVIQFENGLA